MKEFRSFLAPHIRSFIHFRTASQRWNSSDELMLKLFDSYCLRNYPNEKQVNQEIIDSWCRKRDTEKNNSCRSRIYPVWNGSSRISGKFDITKQIRYFTEPPPVPLLEKGEAIRHLTSALRHVCRRGRLIA